MGTAATTAPTFFTTTRNTTKGTAATTTTRILSGSGSSATITTTVGENFCSCKSDQSYDFQIVLSTKYIRLSRHFLVSFASIFISSPLDIFSEVFSTRLLFYSCNALYNLDWISQSINVSINQAVNKSINQSFPYEMEYIQHQNLNTQLNTPRAGSSDSFCYTELTEHANNRARK